MITPINRLSLPLRSSFLLILSVTVSVIWSIAVPQTAQAAGSGGGGSVDAIPQREAVSPEEASERALRAGIRLRDKALKQEAKATNAKSDRAREKALKKATKLYERAAKKQGDALKYNPRNYAAANELGYALRKSGEYRKAIGAYNYALQLNPRFYQATEYRGEAFLALGLFAETQADYMTLFRNDQALAEMLMQKYDAWLEARNGSMNDSEQAFAKWVEERKAMANITGKLSQNNTRRWPATGE